MPSSPWLIRIPEVFSAFAPRVLEELGAEPRKLLGTDYHLVSLADPAAALTSEWRVFTSWNLPLEHAWPCQPRTMDGFVEKAAQALAAKFADRSPQGLFTGPLQPGAPQPYYKHVATNLRGRTLQIFPALAVAPPEAQDPAAPSVFALVGKEGLYAGMATPRECGGFYPGGTKFISQTTAISRAGAKVVEALHVLKLYHPEPAAGAHWLELGASPGGMTSELLARKYRVTAVDRAPLDARLNRAPGLDFHRADVGSFQSDSRFDAILCDMNGDPRVSLRHALRLSANLQPGGLVIFTLKAPGADSAPAMLDLARGAEASASAAGLRLLARVHLSYNRNEFTLFFAMP